MVCFYVTDLYTRCTFNHGRLILSSFVSWPCFRSKFLLSFFYSLRPKTGTQKLHRNPWVYPKCIVCRVIIKALCGNHVVKNVIIPAYYVKTSMIFFTFLKSLSVSFFFWGGCLKISLYLLSVRERERERERERKREILTMLKRYTPARWQCGKHVWETYYIRCGYLICIQRRIISSYNSISFAMLADDSSSAQSIFILSSFVWMSFRKWHLLQRVLLLRNPESDF